MDRGQGQTERIEKERLSLFSRSRRFVSVRAQTLT